MRGRGRAGSVGEEVQRHQPAGAARAQGAPEQRRVDLVRDRVRVGVEVRVRVRVRHSKYGHST